MMIKRDSVWKENLGSLKYVIVSTCDKGHPRGFHRPSKLMAIVYVVYWQSLIPQRHPKMPKSEFEDFQNELGIT